MIPNSIGDGVTSASAPSRRLVYFALDVPHRRNAAFVHVTEIVGELRKRGWRIDLVMPESDSEASVPGPFRRAMRFLRVIGAGVRSLPDHDVLYVRAHLLAWPVTAAARLRGMAIAQEINGLYSDAIIGNPKLRPLRPLIEWLYRSQYRMSDQLFAATEAMADWLRRDIGHDRVTAVTNGANTALFKPSDTIAADPFVVFFGGLTVWHGIDTMIDAVKHPNWPSGVSLLIIGTGLRQPLVENAAREGLQIRFLGPRAYEDIPGLVAGASAGLVPITNPENRSSTGVLPLKLYEVAASGLPVIATELPGQADFVRKYRCGIVIPVGDPAALAAAVAQIVADPAGSRDMGRRGAEAVQAEHSWAARGGEIDNALQAMLDELARR